MASTAIEDFLAALAVDRGAAANTLAAYRRDLEGAEALVGALESVSRGDLAKLGEKWSGLAPATVARKASALRQFFAFLEDEGLPPIPDSIRSGNDESATVVEISARLCYMSYGRGRKDITDFVDNLLSKGDGSVFEHVNYGFAITGVSRALTHELVRHRAGFAYSQRSQRFIDESEGAAAVFIQHHILAQDTHGLGGVLLQLNGCRDGMPIAPHQLPHRGSWPRLRYKLVILSVEHHCPPSFLISSLGSLRYG